LIFAFDGASFDVIDPLLAAGELPNLSQLAHHGLRTEAFSTIPPATLPAWTTFLTAASPSQHGVADMFVPGEAGCYTIRPAGGHLRKLPTILEDLSRRGLSVGSVGVPGTWPPLALNGLCISGFDSPDSPMAKTASCHPHTLAPQLNALGGWRYGVTNESREGSSAALRLKDDLLADLDIRERVLTQLAGREPWDLFVFHLQAADTASHHCWTGFRQIIAQHPPGPQRDRALRACDDPVVAIYRRIDQLFGAVQRAFCNADARATRTLVVSDHGFGAAGGGAVYLNRWLAQNGLLRFRGGGARRLRSASRRGANAALRFAPAPWQRFAFSSLGKFRDGALFGAALNAARGSPVHFDHSAAFSFELDYAPSIWLNRTGTFVDGTLTEDRAVLLAHRIKRQLLNWRDPCGGRPVVKQVHLRSELGNAADQNCPDLVITPHTHADCRPSFLVSDGPGEALAVAPDQMASKTAGRGRGMPGTHRPEGVFLCAGSGIRRATIPALDLREAGAAIYPLIGLPPPPSLRTAVPTWLLPLLPHSCDDQPTANQIPVAAKPAYSASEEAILTRRLGDMGYLG